jgi:hypothetical protein
LAKASEEDAKWYRDYFIKWYKKRYGGITVGFVRTRERLASHRHRTLGQWERMEVIIQHLASKAADGLFSWLPPECISPTFVKARSHRPDVKLSMIIEAAERKSFMNGRVKRVTWETLKPLLDAPKEDIEGLVAMNRLRRLAGGE